MNSLRKFIQFLKDWLCFSPGQFCVRIQIELGKLFHILFFIVLLHYLVEKTPCLFLECFLIVKFLVGVTMIIRLAPEGYAGTSVVGPLTLDAGNNSSIIVGVNTKFDGPFANAAFPMSKCRLANSHVG